MPTLKYGKTTFELMARNLGKVTSLAAAAKVPFENVAALFATLTRNGVRTEHAMTGISAIISTFLKPSKAGTATAKKFGVELNTAAIQGDKLYDTFEKLKGASPEELAKIFPNIRGLKGVIPALQNMSGFAADIEHMKSATGATDAAFEKMSGTLDFLMGRAKEAGKLILSMVGEA